MTRLLFLGLLLAALNAGAAERPVALLEDPAGDDHGSGALSYPQRSDFEPGDLDLRSLRIVRAGDRYRFEATFRNPVRDPAAVAGDAGPESLGTFARRGFYAFNLDVYIDQDRVAGSGNTWTLPGRHAAIAASHAWEKALILTPRPELMRRQLIDAVADREGAPSAEVARRIDASILFATDVRVRHRTVSFGVPASFLAEGRPDAEWSVIAFVTGAKTSIEAELELTGDSGAALERLPLGVMQPKPGRPRDTFGYSGALVPLPVVDLLAPAPLNQKELLSGQAPLAGIAASGRGVAAAPGNASPVTGLTRATGPATAPQAASPATSGDPAERLRRLNALRAEGLISEEEHQELRRKILSEL